MTGVLRKGEGWTQGEGHVERHRERMAACTLRREAWNRPVPHSPQTELTLVMP